jgi:hypothetical protein
MSEILIQGLLEKTVSQLQFVKPQAMLMGPFVSVPMQTLS